MQPGFVKRSPELLALEGWYDTGDYKFKLSCRFRDILRCSTFNGKTEHFQSCFMWGWTHSDQPRRRCIRPNWAIVYVPDKHGNFLGRAFAHLEPDNYNPGTAVLVIDKIHGNRLSYADIERLLAEKGQSCRYNTGIDEWTSRPKALDTYLEDNIAPEQAR
jgi:hypothetical protein